MFIIAKEKNKKLINTLIYMFILGKKYIDLIVYSSMFILKKKKNTLIYMFILANKKKLH